MAKMDKEADAKNARLQKYFDGELPAEERARVEAELSEDDQLKLDALGEVRGLVANTLMAEAADIDLWPALEKQLAASERAAARPRRRWGLRAHPGSWSAGAMMAAAAALLFVFQPWQTANGCDVESLETSGGMATVFNLNDTPHGPTTVIWTEEQD
jgi:anti-sigma-K factor RskA